MPSNREIGLCVYTQHGLHLARWKKELAGFLYVKISAKSTNRFIVILMSVTTLILANVELNLNISFVLKDLN